MRFNLPVVISTVVLGLTSLVSGLGTSCTAPLGPGTAAPGDPYWLQNIRHQGTSAFHPNPGSYQVFRNVKDFGARGDGVTDDTNAINAAIASGNRCGGGGCESTTITPAIVYFPKGTYLVSKPIVALYLTQLIGDAKTLPTLLAASNFDGIAIIDANPYTADGQYYINQNNFLRSIRNFVIDTRRVAPERSQGTGIHWQVSQATSLINIVFELSTAANTAHQGIWMENGSGGYMGDLVFNGGKFGLWVGNQQFTVRNVTVNNAQTAVFSHWNWGWTFQGININNCQVGFDLLTGGTTEETQSVGAQAIIDAVVTNTPIFIRNSNPSNGRLAGSLVINNARLNNVQTAVGVVGGAVVLAGGTRTIASWGQGNVYKGTNTNPTFIKGDIFNPNKPSSLLDSAGRIFGKTHPQYANYALSQIISVKDNGARGDGRTDDTAALQAIFNKFSGCKIIFFDAGTYVVTSTLTIPAGTQIVGEAWTTISGSGNAFKDINNPRPVIRAGEPNSVGILEISDIIFNTIGSTPGAIVVEWNIKQSSQGSAGTWDTHIRLGGAAGTNLENRNCPKSGAGGIPNCYAAFLALHIKPGATAYLEARTIFLLVTIISVYSGRGILSESQGPVWLIGTGSEHHVLYQYNLVGAKNHFLGLIQTESPYYQPTPAAPGPVGVQAAWKDPSFPGGLTSSWGLTVTSSTDIIVFGAGLYSFFSNYSQDCLKTYNCQSQILNVDSSSSVSIFSLSTVGTTKMLSVNGQGIIDQSQNRNGFASTATVWSRT
ncbi:hypothetical protein DXG03_007417 [Asterophora parasitica]|uniref:Rhamnogalacturonase A/B/Epimerase-like pectate lyase domain-containing protein n=1 Tax=Asterophora parasitica TaxID=117018 RepID=A0A9P7G0Q8_9AGAR|nr:hypothetical protein DXG03_007417 [Asterophora parasitica]